MHYGWCKLQGTAGRLQIYRFPLTLNDAFTYLPGCLVFLRLLIAVVKLLQAGAAVGRVGRFVTAMQALVTDAVAIAVAGLLVNHIRDLGREEVRLLLERFLKVRAPKLLRRQDRRQLLALGRWSRMVRRSTGLACSQQRQCEQHYQGDWFRHIPHGETF